MTLDLLTLWEGRHAEGRARQVVIAASPALSARERAKHAAHERVLVDAMTARGVEETTARLLARTALGCLAEAVERWLSRDRSAQPDLRTTGRETFAELADLIAEAPPGRGEAPTR